MSGAMVTALIIDPNDSSEVARIAPTLDALQAVVGGYIECVTMDDGQWHLYCNEEGKLDGLPINVSATAFAHHMGWPRGDVLVGRVILLGNGRDGEEADLPASVLKAWQDFTP